MQRFLDDRHDEHLMHESITSQTSARSHDIQAIIDKVNELGLVKRDVERKQNK